MPVELIHSAEYPLCRLHYIKSEGHHRKPGAGQMEPTFAEAQETLILSNDQIRRLSSADQEIADILDHSMDVKATEVILPCARGDWIKALPALIENGITLISVLLTREQDESQSTTRMCVPVPGHDVIFVPNYKCGYSSMRRYIADMMADDQSGHIGVEQVERKQIDLLALVGNGKTRVSIVRDPRERFFSFYREKVMKQKNYPLFGEPAEKLYGKCDPSTVLSLIADTPDEFRDPHVKSQYGNLFADGVCLVDEWHKIEELSSNLTESLGLPGEFPHMHKTKQRPLPETEGGTDGLSNLLLRVYYQDYQAFGYAPPKN